MLKFELQKTMSQLSTFGIGGIAASYVEVRTIPEMQKALRYCSKHQIPFLVLGKGSNCLFDDQGFDGLVVANKIDFFEQPEPGLLHVGAGYSFSLLGTQTARQLLTGLEFASGIPASVGGAVFMNAGANGAETSNTLLSVDYVDENGNFSVLTKEDLQFSYRTSSFQTMKGAIVGATFSLTPAPEARKKQLEIIAYRTRTQPYGEKSAGCVFRNPSGYHAGALIEKCELKGMQIGGAKVSELHANFIINIQEAKASDVLNLIQAVQEIVWKKTGIALESEIRIISFQKASHGI
jgi:UDP-N-acetylmuramate dehydrogenase